MCGITAVLSNSDDAFNFLFDSLTSLQNRGYDSAGVCCVGSDGKFIVHKKASVGTKSALDFLKEGESLFAGNNIGIAHTRWATHGAKNDVNAHPHVCYRNTVSLVHNGIIDNFKELKAFLADHCISCKSETDSEVVANLISYYHSKFVMKEAIEVACSMLKGTWALVIMSANDPYHLYCTRRSAPLLMACGSDKIILTSETCGLLNEVDHYMPITEGEVYQIHQGYKPTLMKKKLSCADIKLTPHPFKHWTLKEIHEQANTVKMAVNMGKRIPDATQISLGGLEEQASELLECKTAYILGCGTSFYSGQIGEHFMNKLRVFDKVRCVDAAEFDVDWLRPDEKTVLIMISQSGETKDLHKCVEMVRGMSNVVTLGVINVEDSLIAQETDCGVYVNAGREVGVASTKSFTSQVLILTMIALWFHQKQNTSSEMTELRKHYISDLKTFVAKTENVLAKLQEIKFDELVKNFINTSIFVLGTGVNVPVASEGALKIKELTYIHAEGYSYSSLKHGPLALIDAGTPAIFLISDKAHSSKLTNSMMEVKSRLGNTFVVGNHPDADVQIESDNTFAFLWNNMAVQMLAYHLSVAKGNDPDKPRNLAKVVTVL